jgi:beta-glucosidase
MLKAGLGLFDQPYVPENEEITEPTPRARELVRAAAARSTVLLKNDGTLPVTPSGRVLLTGPYATSTDHLGAWTQSFAASAGSIADELRSRYPFAEFTVEPGVGFYDDDPADLGAVAAAAASYDLVLVFAGEPSNLSGEAASRSDLRLPGQQEELIRTVAATGVPFVVRTAPAVTSGRSSGSGSVAPGHRSGRRDRGHPDRSAVPVYCHSRVAPGRSPTTPTKHGRPATFRR